MQLLQQFGRALVLAALPDHFAQPGLEDKGDLARWATPQVVADPHLSIPGHLIVEIVVDLGDRLVAFVVSHLPSPGSRVRVALRIPTTLAAALFFHDGAET